MPIIPIIYLKWSDLNSPLYLLDNLEVTARMVISSLSRKWAALKFGLAYIYKWYYSLREYFIRNFYISSDDGQTQHEYFIIRKNLSNKLVPKGYLLYPLVTNEIDLYKLIK
jgi:hypothetical protein